MSPPFIEFFLIQEAESVIREPKASITNWTIIEVTFTDDTQSNHLLGFVVGKKGRITSAIQKFDCATKTITTRSGRVYSLLGQPGSNRDIQHLIAGWYYLDQIVKYKNVTDNYAKKIKSIVN
ncbi:MAG: hypothetical protein KAI17_27605 [Thiotrichaceae bacterium]|nr:hypothetical protein [Thiotrichaceae bacterium]